MPGSVNSSRPVSPAPELAQQERAGWSDTARNVARDAAAFTARNAVPAMVGYVAGHAVADYMHSHNINLSDYLPGRNLPNDPGFNMRTPEHHGIPHHGIPHHVDPVIHHVPAMPDLGTHDYGDCMQGIEAPHVGQPQHGPHLKVATAALHHSPGGFHHRGGAGGFHGAHHNNGPAFEMPRDTMTHEQRVAENEKVVMSLSGCAAAGASLGAAIGAPIAGIGAGPGAAVGAAAGAIIGLIGSFFIVSNK